MEGLGNGEVLEERPDTWEVLGSGILSTVKEIFEYLCSS